MAGKQTLDQMMVSLHFHYACRALLGGGKGTFVMMQLYEKQPGAYREIMEAAKKHLAEVDHVNIEMLDKRYRELQMIVGDLEKERSN